MNAIGSESDLDGAVHSPPSEAAAMLADVATRYAAAHGPEQTLRFLFDLDARLYSLQGKAAVAFGGGVHTKHRHIRYHDFFVSRVRPGETVLDIGCGKGEVAYDMAERAGAMVTGIDLNPAHIRMATERFGHPRATYILGDALRDLPCGHYDVVVLSNVLEHIEDRVGFLRGVTASAAPNRWLLRVPLFERDWRVPLKKELGMEWRLDLTHFTEYTHESFDAEVKAAGLSVVHRETRWGEIWCELQGAGQ
jgi:SAM-dependent methyltransferase